MPIFLKIGENHDIFPTMLTLLMDKQPFIESVHSSRIFKEPDRFADFKWSWIKKTEVQQRLKTHPLFFFYFVFEGEFLHTTEILYYHIIYIVLSENAPIEGDSTK